jgi:hypothetical protein
MGMASPLGIEQMCQDCTKNRGKCRNFFELPSSYVRRIINKELTMKTKFYLVAVVALLALIVSACGPAAVSQASQPPLRTISVAGAGTAYLVPDIAYITWACIRRNSPLRKLLRKTMPKPKR